MTNRLLSSLALCLIVTSSLITACGDDDDSSGTGTSSCVGPTGETSSAECNACIESKCKTEVSSFCSSNCSKDGTSTACKNATTKVATCAVTNCLSQCETSSDGGSGSNNPLPGSGGSPDTTSNGGSGTDTGSGEGAEINYFCYQMDMGQCGASHIDPTLRDQYDQTCMNGGGTVVDACPSGDDLAGCCTIRPTSFQAAETCVYGTSAPALTEAKCTTMHGVWSTTP